MRTGRDRNAGLEMRIDGAVLGLVGRWIDGEYSGLIASRLASSHSGSPAFRRPLAKNDNAVPLNATDVR
jgi:hypothetical protein